MDDLASQNNIITLSFNTFNILIIFNKQIEEERWDLRKSKNGRNNWD